MPTKCLSISGENGLSRPSCHVIKDDTRNVFTEFPAWRHVSGPLNTYEIAALAKMHWTMHLWKKMHTIAVLRQWLWNNFSGSGTIWHLWPVFLLATAIAYTGFEPKGFHKMTTVVMLHQICDAAPNYQHQKGQNAKPGFAGMPPIQLHGSILHQNSGFVDAGTHGCAGTSLEICVVYTHNMSIWWELRLYYEPCHDRPKRTMWKDKNWSEDPQIHGLVATWFFSCWIYKTNRCTLDKIQLTRMKNTWETH